jgi:hypothetical protein
MMSSSSNGRQDSHRDPIRRHRYDDLAAIVAQTYAQGPGEVGAERAAATFVASPWLPRSHSGRRFVIVAGLVVLMIWGVLYLVFRDWRARYRERAAYGMSQVVPAVDPMAEIAPPGMDRAAWRDAVARTRSLLVTVTASNLLGFGEMRALRDELDQAVGRSRARPDTAVDELAAVWDAMADRAGFLLRDSRSLTGDRHPRPKILPVRH